VAFKYQISKNKSKSIRFLSIVAASAHICPMSAN
jgi:hypothetical protein